MGTAVVHGITSTDAGSSSVSPVRADDNSSKQSRLDPNSFAGARGAAAALVGMQSSLSKLGMSNFTSANGATAALVGMQSSLSKLGMSNFTSANGAAAALVGMQSNLSKLGMSNFTSANGATAAALGIQSVVSKLDTGFLSVGRATAALMGMQSALAKLDTRKLVANVRGPIPGFNNAARSLLEDVGFSGESVDDAVMFTPSEDDRAFEAIHEVAPDIAAAVNLAAAKVRTPFWSRRTVRNALAWMLVMVVVTLRGIGLVLPEPWKSILALLLDLGGISAVGAYKLGALPAQSDTTPPDEQTDSQG